MTSYLCVFKDIGINVQKLESRHGHLQILMVMKPHLKRHAKSDPKVYLYYYWCTFLVWPSMNALRVVLSPFTKSWILWVAIEWDKSLITKNDQEVAILLSLMLRWRHLNSCTSSITEGGKRFTLRHWCQCLRNRDNFDARLAPTEETIVFYLSVPMKIVQIMFLLYGPFKNQLIKTCSHGSHPSHIEGIDLIVTSNI